MKDVILMHDWGLRYGVLEAGNCLNLPAEGIRQSRDDMHHPAWQSVGRVKYVKLHASNPHSMDSQGCPTKIGVGHQMRDESMGFENVGVPVQ